MTKSAYVDVNLFNEGLLDRASNLIAALKEDIKDMKAALEVQQVSLEEGLAGLQEVQDSFYQARQIDLFPGNDIDCGDIFAELVDIVGKEAANRLVDFYSGSSIYIPKNIIIEQKHRKIREEFRRGVVYRELAVRYEYSERYIRTIIHKKERKHEQR
jgi:Mor family transcriptional regulator